MEMLFNNLPATVGTNSSTGLHVTMSMPRKTDSKPNKLKMALLLGEKFILDIFSRRGNSYTLPHGDKILQKLLQMDPAEINDLRFEKLEKLVTSQMEQAKYSTINFKSEENEYGNQLIEFRVAGGTDYEVYMDKIEKTVVRYATVMRAGYSDFYKEDYAKALTRFVHKISKVTKQATGDDPILKAFVAMGSPNNAKSIDQQYKDAKANEMEGFMTEAEERLYNMVRVALENVDVQKFKKDVNPSVSRGVKMAFKRFNGHPKRFLERHPRALKEYYALQRVFRQPDQIEAFVDKPWEKVFILTNNALENLKQGKPVGYDQIHVGHKSLMYSWDDAVKFRQHNSEDKVEKSKKELTDKFNVDYDWDLTGEPNKWVVIDGGRIDSKFMQALFMMKILVLST
jgi:hypothetical protein